MMLRYNENHKWYYYPKMAKDECLVFKVYDKKEDGPRFVFHTAFDDPSSPPNAPPRKSIEVRTIAFFDTADDGDAVASSCVAEDHVEGLRSKAKPIFYDMVHSNNAARVRLWLQLKGMGSKIETRTVTYPDLQTEEFKQVTLFTTQHAEQNEKCTSFDYTDTKLKRLHHYTR